MGVPKFFRYISERYPCLIEFVKEYQIPEFDNLYLDMNGIIHNCSHPDDNNVHFRITEEKIFQDIFHYIEVLFRMIKPQKLFFMAVDGVAPRAKMNQQRGRRFRSAKEADKMAEEAKKKGEKLPDEARFDSNCITPGTVFMAKLHEQLKYFVVDKISNDPLWQKCKIVLSGHETPGEGEHKIMDYIRFLKSQPGYDPNTRHCLYGLDADLIMLGLCTHEPHFSLLREEVKFGTKKNGSKKITCPEEIVFLLLHLSLMREYLEMEFFELKDKLKGFEYDFEKIIDDWVLMGFLVGNDFIPSLPNLHIANGALPLLYRAYIDILPTLDGYINEAGKLNLKRFEEFMKKLGELDLENFEEIRADIEYMESKTGRKYNHHSKVSMHSPPVRDSGLAALIKETEDIYISSDTEKSDDENSDEDSAFSMYKQEYYKNKLEYTQVTPEVMRDQAEGYVRAIQWNLNYYYNGCCSWSWYYPHHYSPYISDIKGFTNLDIQFDLGKPFKPFEQLLAVLPSASKDLLPKAYHKLMTEESSPIKDYYPEAFQTDLNGKKQEWEAVVLIPFIDEKRLLEAMQNCEKDLTEDEVKRNTHGPMLIYSYTTNDMGPYEAPQYFPKVFHNHAKLQTLSIDDIRVPIEKLVKGAFPQTKTGVYFPGFPTFKHLQYKGHLAKEKIKVFETPSRNENMIVTILGKEETDLPKDLLGKIVFASWPHLVEAKVIAVSNSKTKMFLGQNPNNDQNNKSMFDSEQRGILEYYRNRLGIDCGPTTILVHVQLMIGRKYIFSPNGRITLEKQFAKEPSAYPLQTIVKDINAFDTFHSNFRDIESVFAIGSICYTITTPYYGCRAVVQDSKETLKDGRIKIAIVAENEPDFSAIQSQYKNIDSIYMSSSKAAQFVGMRSSDFARITSSIFLTARNGEGGLKRVSVGLNLRFNKKDQETPGYTKKINNYWNYSHKTIELVKQYATKFHEVVAFICNNRFDEGIDVEVIFGDEWEEKLKELNEWLRSLPTHNAERRQCGSEALEPDLVQKIEEVVDNFKPTEMKKITLQIKPNCLYKPEIQTAAIEPDSSMTVELFDRVVNIREGYSVPFGEKGTVIAIQKPQNEDKRSFLYDIVFDKAFKDGMTLNCSEGRGYRLPRTAFINISHGKRLQNKLQGNSTDMKLKLEAFARNPNSAFASYNPAPVPMPRPQGYHQYYPEQQGYFRGPNAQNYIRPRAPFPQKPAFNNFMPNFQQRQPVPPVQILTKKPDNSTCDESIMLKQLLKIGGEDKKGKAQASTSKAFPSPPKTIPASVPKVENKLNLNEIFAQAANTAPTVRLLTYYQSNGLGLPRYQYFSKDNAFLAQLTLPNGKVVTGKSANTREMASESVAAAVLDIFMKSQTAINTKVFPAPPQKWVNSNQSQENSNDKPQRDNKLKAFNKTNNAYESKKNDGSSKKGNPHAFVPLQVARNQIKQQSSANGSKTQNFKPQEMSSNETTKNHVQKEKIFHNSRKQEKSPTKPRKTRIAANFVKK